MTRVWFMSYGWQCLFCKRMNAPKGTVCYNCGRDYAESSLRVVTYTPMDLPPLAWIWGDVASLRYTLPPPKLFHSLGADG